MKSLLFILLIPFLATALYAQAQTEEDDNSTKTPLADFLAYQKAYKDSRKPQDIYPYVTEEVSNQMKALDRSTRLNNWIIEKKLLSGFKVIDMIGEAEVTGRRARIELKGYDAQLQERMDWDVVMIYENARWRFSERVIHPKSQITNDVRTWVIGRDEVEIKAMLKRHDSEKIELAVVDSKSNEAFSMLELPISELSKADIDYLNERILPAPVVTESNPKNQYYNVIKIYRR